MSDSTASRQAPEAATRAVALQSARAALWRALTAEPQRHDFYQTLRRIECLWQERPRLGRALRPIEEAVRLAQDPELDFAPAPIGTFRQAENAAAPRLGVRFFGLFGSHGPLPLHLTELARDRERNSGDASLRAFIDIFQHRLLALFYRGWAQAQPAVDLDRPRQARFDSFVGALGGIGQASMRQRDQVRDNAKRQHIALLARGVRCAEGLADILTNYLGLPVQVRSFVGHWMRLSKADRTRLGSRIDTDSDTDTGASRLGVGAVAGDRVWDRQSKFRLIIGPLSKADYARFLPGESAARVVRDWVRQYVGFDFVWDVQLVHAGAEIVGIRLGADQRLGLATWLGATAGHRSRDDLVFAPEERTTQVAR